MSHFFSIGPALAFALLVTGLQPRGVRAESPKPGRTLGGNASEIRRVLFSPDGKKLAAHMIPGKAVLWDLDTGKRLEVGEGPVEPIGFSPDGKFLILKGGQHREIQSYDLGTNRLSLTFPPGAGSVAISPDGRFHVLYREVKGRRPTDKTVSIEALSTPFDIGSGRIPASLNFAYFLRCGFTADSKTFWACQSNQNVSLWDTANGEQQYLTRELTYWSLLSPDARLALISLRLTDNPYAARGPIAKYQVFDVSARRAVATLNVDRPIHSIDTAFSPDGSKIASVVTYDLCLWDASTGALIRKIETSGSHTLHRVVFTPDGKMIVAMVTTKKPEFRFWDVATGRVSGSIPSYSPLQAFSPDGSTMVTENEDHSLQFWDLPGATPIRTAKASHPPAAPAQPRPAAAPRVEAPKLLKTLAHGAEPVDFLAYSRDGRTLASHSWDGELKVWNARTGHVSSRRGDAWIARRFRAGPTGPVPANAPRNSLDADRITVGPDGKRIAWIRHTDDDADDEGKPVYVLQFWSPPAKGVEDFSGPKRFQPRSQAFTPDGKSLLIGCARKVLLLWDLEAGRITANMREARDDATILSVAISGDGTLAAAGNSEGAIDVWDLTKRSKKLTVTTSDKVDSISQVVFSPDGKSLAANTGRSIRIIDLAAGQTTTTVGLGLVSVAYSADGKTLILCDAHRSVMLWDIATNEALATIPDTSGIPALSPDGRTLATGTRRGEIQLWEMPASEGRRAAPGRGK